MNVCSISRNEQRHYFIVFHRYHVWFVWLLLFFFTPIEGLRQPWIELELSNSTGIIFPTAFAHFMCHVLGILTVFQTFQLLLPSLLLDMTTVLFWGIMNHTHIRQWTWLIRVNLTACSDCSMDPPSLGLSPSPWSSWLPEDTTILKWGQLITLQWPLRVQTKGRVTHFSL